MELVVAISFLTVALFTFAYFLGYIDFKGDIVKNPFKRLYYGFAKLAVVIGGFGGSIAVLTMLVWSVCTVIEVF